MTLQQYADTLGVTYRTAWQHFKDGRIPDSFKVGKVVYVPDNILNLLKDNYDKNNRRG